MAAQTREDFRKAVLALYDAPAQLTQRAGVDLQLNESLRGLIVKFRDATLSQEFQIANPPTGDQATILLLFRGDLEQIVETWQQTMLSRPRVAITANDDDFRDKVLDRYNMPSVTESRAEVTRALEGELARRHVTFWELIFQLHLCADALQKEPDHDLGEQTKENLKALVRTWKASLLCRPRAVTENTRQP